MADQSTQRILEALSRAAADPAGLPLFGSKTASGLFAATARQAAQQCKDQGYLRVVRTESKGKSLQEICAITDKGLAHLLAQLSPKRVLEDLVRTLGARQAQANELVAVVRQWQASMEALQAIVAKVLPSAEGSMRNGAPSFDPQSTIRNPQSSNGSGYSWTARLLTYLADRQAAGATGDCPLPELYRQAQAVDSSLTIGRFHDGLRRLHEQEQIYLHPWTGPLYDLPEPPYALLIGHEIAYYASRRPA